MAGLKRKEAPLAKGSSRNTNKKPKIEAKHLGKKPKARSRDAEVETDSDPIVESDTTENSGDDDDVTWPSDGDEVVDGSDVDGGGRLAATQSTKQAKSSVQKGGANGGGNSTASKESHAKQKQVALERKAAKPNADSIARTKKIWERLRIQSAVPLEERKALVAELFDIITGRVKDLVLKHDSGRVIQTALKYANLEQRKMIARELKGDYCTLAEGKYSKFVIGKILVHGDDEIRDMVVPELYGRVRRLIKHPEGSWILDDIYRGAASSKQKARLLSEWYGAEFAIFKPGKDEEAQDDLKALLAKHPAKRGPVMRYLLELINQLIQKKTAGFTMLHDAMLQYYLNVTPGSSEALEFVELLKGDEEGDLLRNLAFTKSGSHLVSLALAYGTAKDRKILLKAYKSTMQPLAADPHGLQVILTAYDVIDDTVLTSNTIFPALLPKDPSNLTSAQVADFLATLTNLNTRIPLMYPFTHKPSSILPPNTVAILSEVHAIRTTTSKKDAQLRRTELAAALSPPLLSFIAAHAAALVATSFGCQFLTEVLLSAPGSVAKTAALDAVAALAGPDAAVDTKAALSTAAAGRMLKALVHGGRFNATTRAVEVVGGGLGFADALFARIGGEAVAWAAGANAFVVVGLLESGDFAARAELVQLLREGRSVLAAAAEGAERVAKEGGEGEGTGEGKRRGKGKGKNQGKGADGKMDDGSGATAGLRLVLEKIDG